MDFMEFVSNLDDSEEPLENELLLDASIMGDVSDGARKKMWVMKDGYRMLYKSSKINSFGEYTYEHLSEFLAMRIARQLGIDVVDIIMGTHDVLSKVMYEASLHSFIELSDEFSHSFHMSNLSTFDISTLLNEFNNPYCKDIIQMLLFDALIGNSDRHPGNFLYSEERGFYPLFDNGSSLCAYERDCNIPAIFKDATRFNAICVTKSKPVLRCNQKVTHKELIHILRNAYFRDYSKFRDRLCNFDFHTLWEGISVSEERVDLINKFLATRLSWYE